MEPHRAAVIINDHRLVSDLLTPYLQEMGFEDVKVYTDAEIALEGITLVSPELVVIDMMLPVFRTGDSEAVDIDNPYILMDNQVAFRAIRNIKKGNPNTKVLILTGERHPHPFLLGFEAGADGIASKLDGLSDCLRIFQEVLQGKTWVTSARMVALIHSYKNALIPTFTPLEIHILELVQEGLDSPEIGKQLGYSSKTIRNVLSKINDKLGTTSRFKSLQKAIDIGLIGWRTGQDRI